MLGHQLGGLTTTKQKIMAINIDTVYQRVLAISNKEQRGYITPLEFNLMANQAQLDIFNQYFFDLGQFKRQPKYDLEYSDSVAFLEEKMSIFELFKQTPIASSNNVFTLSTDLYQLGNVYHTISSVDYEVEEVSKRNLIQYQLSPLSTPVAKRPVFTRKTDSGNKIEIFPSTITSAVTYNYIKKPADVSWGYTIINGETLYNSNTAVNFELHASEETVLVIKILAIAGIIIKDPSLYQISSQEEVKNIQQEKA
tara:strand:- start:63 stop:821 length:759 start_codon:yes stop_codon:yes gene_type:complete